MPNINASARFAHPAPGERLPVEILLMIFEATLVADHSCVLEVMRAESAKFYASPRFIEYIKPAPLAAPLVLSQVSRRWRQIVLSTPSLWRNIAVPRFDWATPADTAQSDSESHADSVHHDDDPGPSPGACKRLVALWLEHAVSAGANKLNLCHAHPPSSDPNPVPCEHDIDSYAGRSAHFSTPESDVDQSDAGFLYLRDVYDDLAAYHTRWESLNLVLDTYTIKKFVQLVKRQQNRFRKGEDAVEVLGQNLKELTITLPMTIGKCPGVYMRGLFAWIRRLASLKTFVLYDHYSSSLWSVDVFSELTSPRTGPARSFNSLDTVETLTHVRLFPTLTDQTMIETLATVVTARHASFSMNGFGDVEKRDETYFANRDTELEILAKHMSPNAVIYADRKDIVLKNLKTLELAHTIDPLSVINVFSIPHLEVLVIRHGILDIKDTNTKKATRKLVRFLEQLEQPLRKLVLQDDLFENDVDMSDLFTLRDSRYGIEVVDIMLPHP
ncbi:hypothetical protein CPC08DRAFT_806878 [Agrocybe pediades]|nr:hypothetical protein CPC08DRAFT_806878 [Agrocybe pediades]